MVATIFQPFDARLRESKIKKKRRYTRTLAPMLVPTANKGASGN